MHKVLLVIFFTVVLVSKSTFSQSSGINYQSVVYDTIFDEIVPDPMRWLENTAIKETKNWVNNQDSIYKDFLKTINKELTITGNYIEKYKQISYNAPVKKGDFYFFIYYNEFDNYYDLYMSREKQFDITTAYIVFSPKSISKTDNPLFWMFRRASRTTDKKEFVITFHTIGVSIIKASPRYL